MVDFTQDREKGGRVLRWFYHEIQLNDLTGLSAEIAYFGLLSLFPLLLVISSVLALVLGSPQGLEEVMITLKTYLPEPTTNLLQQTLNRIIEGKPKDVLSVGFLVLIWPATRVIASLMKALNRILGVEEGRNFLTKTLVGAVIILSVSGWFIAASFFYIFSGPINSFAVMFNILPLKSFFESHLNDLITLTIVTGAALMFYLVAPYRIISVRKAAVASIFFSISWFLGTSLFRLYVERYMRYNELYGFLGSIIVLMMWFYLTSFSLLIGCEIIKLMYCFGNVVSSKSCDMPRQNGGLHPGHTSKA